MLEMIWAFIKGDRHIYIPIGTAVLGLLVGYLLFGVVFTPDPVDTTPESLRDADYKQFYLRSLATAYTKDPNFRDFAVAGLGGFDNPAVAVCQGKVAAENSGDLAAAQSLDSLARLLDTAPNGCADVNLAPAEESGGLSFMTCLWGLALLILLGAFGYVWQQRRGGGANDIADYEMDFSKPPTEVPTEGPISTDSGDGDSDGEPAEATNVTAIASYRTTFVRGYDAYDDSFSIENVGGDFLGECGVGISESIGTDSPKSVTALEVWLFDKNDIRTITKVAMSDHAFFDEAIKAKLAPKGEPVLARQDEVVVLETAALIINARITEIVYGDNPDLPEKSYFEKLSIEISAWSQGDGASSGGDSMGFDF